MPVDRPTFSESWYRVASLRPRLRSTVQVHRQHFRGRMWHVLQDPASNQFFRLNEPAYHFVAMLDGRRTVADVWGTCNEQLGDDAPTQGEVIQLLGQLYVSNLLQAELPPDAEAMFNRYRKRIRREVQGYLMSLLFARIPLLDPDPFLNRWVGVFGRVFSVFGMIAWLGLVGTGMYFLTGRAGDLFKASTLIFDPANLWMLYLSVLVVKVFHEFSHGFACKRFGRVTGTGGEVHVMGVMFLVFVPLPYVDASSAWAFRSKWHRVVVGAAGMLTELALAAIAAIVWANTTEGAPVHTIAYYVMFIASVSSLLFNGNPLLRFDGYYIFSDLVEIPNLWNRSREYLYYLVRRYVWGVRQARSPAHTRGERGWMSVYAIASTVYRVFIFAFILLTLTRRLPRDLAVIAVLFGILAVIGWLVVPLGKFVHYLATNGELTRVRSRATLTTLAVTCAALLGVGAIPAPDRTRVEGVVEPVHVAIVHPAVDGFVEQVLASGVEVSPEGEPLVKAVSPELSARREELQAERRRLVARKRLAETEEIAAAQILTRQIAALDEQIARVNEEVASLEVHAPIPGTWVAPEIERLRGAYVRRGDRIGLVASLDDVFIRAAAGQTVAATEASKQVEIRVKGKPGLKLGGIITRILPAGQEHLPSAALGYAAGGAIPVAPDDAQGTKAAERVREIHIRPDADAGVTLLSGQRVVVRLEMPPRPLLLQWWRSLLQVIQKRFFI
ncbi:MAG TPA: PqqD family peptide modification chaperone [Planctomycetota bacterium]|nr:PqqD family peptide modification chaperone [Planctomycetota bacterium]